MRVQPDVNDLDVMAVHAALMRAEYNIRPLKEDYDGYSSPD